MPNVTTLLVLTAVLAMPDTMVTGKAAKVIGNERNVRDSLHIPRTSRLFLGQFVLLFKAEGVAKRIDASPRVQSEKYQDQPSNDMAIFIMEDYYVKFFNISLFFSFRR